MITVALVLAGGEGKRFSPLQTSKPLFPFFGDPILTHTLKSLKKSGFMQAVVVTTSKDQEQIRRIKIPGLRIQTVVQKQPKGMADALVAAEPVIRGKSLLVLNATDQVDQNVFALMRKNIGKHQAFIVARRQEGYFGGGYLEFSAGKFTGIVEKPGEGNQPSDLVNLVFHYVAAADPFVELLKTTTSTRDDVYEKALSRLAKATTVGVLRYTGYWQTLKHPWDALDMTRLFLTKKLEPRNQAQEIHPSAHIDRNVHLGKGVKVFQNAVIKGPCYIGPHTTIGTGSLVVESMIGSHCVVGFASEVTRSYVGDGCWLHTNYIGDSLLEGKNYFGAGAVTANFRFDEGDVFSMVRGNRVNTLRNKLGAILALGVRVGVNASLMPGVKVGTGALIGPGWVQYQDLEEGGHAWEPSSNKKTGRE